LIYMVEIDFDKPEDKEEWHAYYAAYMQKLLTLPKFETAQRLRALSANAPGYLAIYSVRSLDVFDSEPYHALGGGGRGSLRWKDVMQRRRNIFNGLERVPAVTEAGTFLVTERDPREFALADILFLPLVNATGPRQAGLTAFDGDPEHRWIALVDAKSAEDRDLAALDGLCVYGHLTDQVVPSAAGETGA
jgi:hypothetical protein